MTGSTLFRTNGKEHMAASSIAICGLARDCAQKLPGNIAMVNALRHYFKRSVVVVVENDSKDQTRSLLNEWAAQRPRTFILDGQPDPVSLTIPVGEANPFYALRRVSKLASLRNQYIVFLNELQETFDYLLVMDFDVDLVSLPGIVNAFERKDQWDVVTAYGYSLSPSLRERYHDAFALIPVGEEGRTRTESSIKKLQSRFRLKKGSHQWVPVWAAFGGLSIYSVARQTLPLYTAVVNDDPRVQARCEHIDFVRHWVNGSGRGVMVSADLHLRYQTFWDALKRKLGYL